MNQFYQLLIWCFAAFISFNPIYAELNPDDELFGSEVLGEEADPLLIPNLISPTHFAHFESTTTDVELTWSVDDLSNITGFIIEYKINNVDATPIVLSSTLDMSYTLTGLLPGSRVSWRVASVNTLDEETWSDWSLFFVQRDHIVYVTPDGGGGGTSWTDATNLRSALRNYVYGDVLWVAQGIYKPTTSGDRTFRFNIEEGVQIYGGFVGYEAELTQRNWKKNKTIFSGNIGDVESITDNSYNVLSFDGSRVAITELTRLDGLIIEDGYANLSSGNNNRGGAFQLRNASPTIVNTHFRNNFSTYGGAIYANSVSAATFYNCLFEGNSASTWGGALNVDGNVTIVNSVFYGNQATDRGGAISGPALPGQINIYNSIFWNNFAPIGNQVYGQSNIRYSIVQGAEPKINLYNDDPLFINPTAGDFRINQNSPALNKGSNSFLPGWLTMDFNNSPRTAGTSVDIGIYEGVVQVPEILLPLDFSVVENASTSVDLTWSWSPDPTFVGYELEYQINDGAVVSQSAGTDASFIFTEIVPASEIKWRVGAKNSNQELIFWSAWSNFIINRDAPLFVKSGATGGGSSWTDAMSLHTAMDIAVYGDEVWVAAGTYKPTTTGDRSISFNLREGVKLYGGFSGVETSLEQRNFLNNPTIFSGNIGSASLEADNSYNVFRIVGTAQKPITDATIIDGIYVQDGYADISTGNRDSGGGMYFSYASPTISNVWFRFNYAKRYGGAIYSDANSTPKFGNVIFSHNFSALMGGGSYTSTAVEFYNCVFYSNKSRYGGALSSEGSTSIAYNSIFWSNIATDDANDLDYADAKFSIVQDGSGTGSITVNPQLEDPSNGDFSFDANSSAVDVGSSAHVPSWLTKDYYGNQRVIGTSVDVGVFEYDNGTFIENKLTDFFTTLEVWPNPVAVGSELYVRVSDQNQNGFFVLRDFSGVALNQWRKTSQGIISLGNLNLPSGLYFITFEGDNGKSFSVKLVVK